MGAVCQCLQSIDPNNLNIQNDVPLISTNREIQNEEQNNIPKQVEPEKMKAAAEPQQPMEPQEEVKRQESWKPQVEEPQKNIEVDDKTKLMGMLKTKGMFISEADFEDKIPYDFLSQSQTYPYNPNWTYQEQMNNHKVQPIKLQNGNYYWGSWDMNCQMDGSGKLIISDESAYLDGVWRKGLLVRGRLYLSASFYEGDFKNSEYHGHGRLIDKNENYEYEGDFVDGLKEGQGRLVFSDGSKYVGEFKGDGMDGHGEWEWSSRYKYKGNFAVDALCGEGSLVSPNGSSFQGNIISGNFNGGNCVFIWSSGEKYEGDYNWGVKEGKGVYSFNDCRYDGQWYAGKPHGRGKFETPNKVIHGFWRGGEMIEKTSEEPKNNEEDNTNYSPNFEPLEEDININDLPFISHEEEMDIAKSANYAQENTQDNKINLDEFDN